jgi:phage tail assembly protein T
MLAGMTSSELGDWHQFYREHYFQDAQLDAHFSGCFIPSPLFFRDPELTPAHFSLLSPSGIVISDDEPDDDTLMTAAGGSQEVSDMAQQISDLVINLDVDRATFSEQVARIKGPLTGWLMTLKKFRRECSVLRPAGGCTKDGRRWRSGCRRNEIPPVGRNGRADQRLAERFQVR